MRKTKSGGGRRQAGRATASFAVGVLALISASPAWALTITFDDVPGLAPTSAGEVVPGGSFGPHLDFGEIVFDGGIIGLAITPFDEAATTLPNFLVTTDVVPLADGSVLPGEITAALTSPASDIRLDVGNGNVFPAAFTLTAFSGAAVVGSDTVSLPGFGGTNAFVGELSVSAAAITSFLVTSTQPAGTKAFTIDTLGITFVPAPAAAALIASGLVFLGYGARR